MKELQLPQANIILNSFCENCNKYQFVLSDGGIINEAQELIIKYGTLGLRTLDAIQLATAISIKNALKFAVTADILLNNFLEPEGLGTLTY